MRLFSATLLLTLAASPALGDADDTTALAAFKAGFAGGCDVELVAEDSLLGPVGRHDLVMPQAGSEPVAVSLWLFPCLMGAYNLTSVAYLKDDFWGIHPVSFAKPDFQVVQVDPDDPESAIKEIKVLGWTASPFLTNASFDPKTLTMINLAYWRGLGDVSDGGNWTLVDGAFRLTHYEVDATYEDEVNPVTLYPAP